jgi:hypothetical protein
LLFDLLLRSRSDVFQRDTAVDHQFDPGEWKRRSRRS